ncbi:hypothetical protein [Azohydromonas australica]|uniref:hypothetical protein n=1 Tax=Azohydromonas australica TaxID=364039 RepID=UPI0004026B21|nr:hypothetical protein [Azohydromonas australica]
MAELRYDLQRIANLTTGQLLYGARRAAWRSPTVPYDPIAPGVGYAPGLIPLGNTTEPMLQHTKGRDCMTNLVDAMRSDIPRSERREMAAGCLDAPHIIPAGSVTRYLDQSGRLGMRFSWRDQLDCGALAWLVKIERVSAQRRDGCFPCWWDTWDAWAAHAALHYPREFSGASAG